MLIKNRKVWLRVVTGFLLLGAGILNWLGWYVNEGILQRLDRMNEEQRSEFLDKLKPHERDSLVKRLDLYRKAKTPGS